jgi:hypothetical protein
MLPHPTLACHPLSPDYLLACRRRMLGGFVPNETNLSQLLNQYSTSVFPLSHTSQTTMRKSARTLPRK